MLHEITQQMRKGEQTIIVQGHDPIAADARSTSEEWIWTLTPVRTASSKLELDRARAAQGSEHW
jgi:hypothetical protein